MPIEGESTRRFNARIEAAVTALGDEALTDYWTARQRARQGHQPEAHRPRVQRLAPPVGLGSPTGQGRSAAARTSLARPGLSVQPAHGTSPPPEARRALRVWPEWLVPRRLSHARRKRFHKDVVAANQSMS
jgi:hypothetical protein